jgi:hypothetical protein
VSILEDAYTIDAQHVTPELCPATNDAMNPFTAWLYLLSAIAAANRPLTKLNTHLTIPEGPSCHELPTVILGGGVVGLSTAYYLSQSIDPACIYILDSAPELCAGASGQATGILHYSSDLSYRGQLGEGDRGPSRARSRVVVASRGRIRGGCGVKAAVRG